MVGWTLGGGASYTDTGRHSVEAGVSLHYLAGLPVS